MLALQLKKYKATVSVKQAKLGSLEKELAERRKQVEAAQKAYDEQAVQKCQNDKDMLSRLKNSVKTLRQEHQALKKQVLKQAELVKEIDEGLSELV